MFQKNDFYSQMLENFDIYIISYDDFLLFDDFDRPIGKQLMQKGKLF